MAFEIPTNEIGSGNEVAAPRERSLHPPLGGTQIAKSFPVRVPRGAHTSHEILGTIRYARLASLTRARA